MRWPGGARAGDNDNDDDDDIDNDDGDNDDNDDGQEGYGHRPQLGRGRGGSQLLQEPEKGENARQIQGELEKLLEKGSECPNIVVLSVDKSQRKWQRHKLDFFQGFLTAKNYTYAIVGTDDIDKANALLYDTYHPDEPLNKVINS